MSSDLTPYNFTLSDQSPLFQYLPFRDGPIDSSWNVTYSGDSDSAWAPDSFIGAGTSSHRTTFVGASVQLDWTGTAIFLYGEANAGAYTIQLDSVQTAGVISGDNLLFSATGLSYGPHSLKLEVVQSGASIYSAIITVGMGASDTTVQVRNLTTTLPPTSPGFVLSGVWTQSPQLYGFTSTPYSDLSTTSQGATMTFSMSSASAFAVLGSVNYNHGAYNVTLTPPSDLGPPQTSQLNGSSRWVGLDAVIYLATGLNRSRTYQVDITNESPGLFVDTSKVMVYDTVPSASSSASASSSSSSHTSRSLGSGAIAGLTVGIVCALLAAAALIVFVRRRRRQSYRSKPDGFMIEQEAPPLAGIPVPYVKNYVGTEATIGTAELSSAVQVQSGQGVIQETDAGPLMIPPTYDPTWTGSR